MARHSKPGLARRACRVWRAGHALKRLPYFFSFLLEAKSREPVCNQSGGLDCPSSAILAQRNGRFETKVSRPACLSTSNAKQKTERRRAGWDEQQLHRSLGQLILTKLAQRQIHTRPSEARHFSFAVARYYEGGFNSVPDLSAM
jgi:hypothetical protein